MKTEDKADLKPEVTVESERDIEECKEDEIQKEEDENDKGPSPQKKMAKRVTSCIFQ